MSGSETRSLTVYERMPDPLEATRMLGNAIAKSGMFGCGSVEAGQVFAMECLARRMPPLMLAERYHVICGKLSMKAEAMLAGFEAEGGKYKVLSRTPDLVEIEVTINDGTHRLSLSWEDAQKEPFVYDVKEAEAVKLLATGKKPPLKPKYATPRARMQMLWARLVSDSVRFLCPKVVSGAYTPEEISDFDEVAAESPKPAASGQASVVDQAAAAAAGKDRQPVQDAEFEIKAAVQATPEAAAAAQPPAPIEPAGPQYATDDQRQLIKDLFDALGMTPEQREKALAKRHVSSLRSLTVEQAVELAGILDGKLKQLHDAKLPPFEPGTQQPGGGVAHCTEEQERQIKSALMQWKQIDPAKYAEEFPKFTAKLAESRRTKIRELSFRDAETLLHAVQVRCLDSFIKLSLAPKEVSLTPAAAEAKAA